MTVQVNIVNGKVLVMMNNEMCTGMESHWARLDHNLIELVKDYQEYYNNSSGSETDFDERCEEIEGNIRTYLSVAYPDLDLEDLGDLDTIEIEKVDHNRKFAIIPNEWGGEKVVDQNEVPLFDLAALIDSMA